MDDGEFLFLRHPRFSPRRAHSHACGCGGRPSGSGRGSTPTTHSFDSTSHRSCGSTPSDNLCSTPGGKYGIALSTGTGGIFEILICERGKGGATLPEGPQCRPYLCPVFRGSSRSTGLARRAGASPLFSDRDRGGTGGNPRRPTLSRGRSIRGRRSSSSTTVSIRCSSWPSSIFPMAP